MLILVDVPKKDKLVDGGKLDVKYQQIIKDQSSRTNFLSFNTNSISFKLIFNTKPTPVSF